MIYNYASIFLILIFASTVQASTGFGLAIISLPLISMFFPMQTAVVSISLLSLCLSSQIAWKLRKNIDFKFIIAPLVLVFIGRTVGLYLLMNTPPLILKKVLGGLLIVLALYFILCKNKIKIKPTILNGSVAGGLSGVLGGLFGMSGPPLVVYYLAGTKDKQTYNASLQATFAIGNIYTLILYLVVGNITNDVLILTGSGIAAVTIGAFIGLKLFRRLNQNTLTKIIYAMLIAMGIMFIVR